MANSHFLVKRTQRYILFIYILQIYILCTTLLCSNVSNVAQLWGLQRTSVSWLSSLLPTSCFSWSKRNAGGRAELSGWLIAQLPATWNTDHARAGQPTKIFRPPEGKDDSDNQSMLHGHASPVNSALPTCLVLAYRGASRSHPQRPIPLVLDAAGFGTRNCTEFSC